VGQVCSNVYGNFVGGIIAIGWAGVIKCLWELCWWEFSYSWGLCVQMLLGAVLVGM